MDAILLTETTVEHGVQFDLEKIADLCRQYQVRRLAVFGSILRADFESSRSDADFMVEFEAIPAAVRIQNYMKLRDALGRLLSRPIDLIEEGSIQNPYILRKVREEQQLLYAA